MKRILSLDGFRFIMCCTIFIGHCTWLNDYKYGYIHQIFFQNSSLALDYFFMLSGFGMYLNYNNTKHIFGGGALKKGIHCICVFNVALFTFGNIRICKHKKFCSVIFVEFDIITIFDTINNF